VDKDGTHVDFTFDIPEQYDYFGIVIPDKLVLLMLDLEMVAFGIRYYLLLKK